MTETCIMCGEEIPEGRQVCPRCESKYNQYCINCSDCVKEDYNIHICSIYGTEVQPYDTCSMYRKEGEQ